MVKLTKLEVLEKSNMLKGTIFSIDDDIYEVLANGNIVYSTVYTKNIKTSYYNTSCSLSKDSELFEKLTIIEKPNVYLKAKDFNSRVDTFAKCFVAINIDKLDVFIDEVRAADNGQLNLNWWTKDVINEMKKKYLDVDTGCCFIYREADRLFIKNFDKDLLYKPYMIYDFGGKQTVDDYLSIREKIYKAVIDLEDCNDE